MKVWQVVSDPKSVVLLNDEQYKAKLKFKGEKVGEWDAIPFYTSIKGKYSDFPSWMPHVPVVSPKAREVLQDYIKDDVQFLPIKHDEVEGLCLVNVHNILDCIDYERSQYLTMPSGKFGGFTRKYFKEDIVKDEWIFKIREEASVYVTDKFRDLVISSGLKGIDFHEIWDSELTVEIEQEREQRYQQKVQEIEQSTALKMDWATASPYIEAGKAIASGKWKLQKDKKGKIVLGQLTFDLTYVWTNPLYYPPILLELMWHEIELSDI